MSSDVITAEQRYALGIARDLVGIGMPMFLARPDEAEPSGFALPGRWQLSTADPQVVDNWRPGLALCAVTGHVLDLIDLDPRSGADLDRPNEGIAGVPVMASAYTPSGGVHRFVLPIGIASRDGAWPGVDIKSGAEDGQGRGFAFLAPTVRRSKVDGLFRTYTWFEAPNPQRVRNALSWIGTHSAGNAAAEPIRRRIAELRAERAPSGLPRRLPESVARMEWDRAYARLVADLRVWAAAGWGGAAHAGLLTATTHLARLSPDNAAEAYLAAFTAVGIEADAADLAKLHSAIDAAVPDVVVPDADMPPQELFWAGADVPGTGGDAPGPRVAGLDDVQAGHVFAPVTRERFRNRQPAPRPSVGTFGGQGGLFYPQGVHWLQGESESGKSWVALAVVAERLRAGDRVAFVDYEATMDSILERLDQLGVTDDEVELLTYVDGTDVLFTELCAHVRDAGYGLLVVDGVTSSLTSAGLSGRDEQELTRWTDVLARRARMAICVDHVVKAVDDRRGMAVGTQAKKSVVTGSSYEVVCRVKFGRGSRDGLIVLNLQKDKPGGLRGHGIEAVKLRFVSDPASGAVSLVVPSALLDTTTDFFREDDPTVRAQAIYERLLAWEASGSAMPPKLGIKEMRTFVRDELNEQARHDVVDTAVRLFKRGKGQPVAEDG